MNVKQGDLVNVNGVESIVETSWGQGKHKIFKLMDGRQIADLDKLIASGQATIVAAPIQLVAEDKPKKTWNL